MLSHRRGAWMRALLCASALLLPMVAGATPSAPAAALHRRHAELKDDLARNDFQRPLHLVSTETKGSTRGDVYVVVQHPFARVVAALRSREHWCDIMILHVNTKYCRPFSGPAGEQLLRVAMGRKFDQALEDAYPVDFAFHRPIADAGYLEVSLDAPKGPMGTRDYRIGLEAVPLDAKRTFIHFSYANSYGTSARVAMQTYLATLGRAKVGFTVIEHSEDGEPVYVDGVRGAVERNAMRYALAIEACLGAWTTAPAQQLEKRLNDWFTATERHALQLNEMDRDEYLTMKRSEVLRQQQSAVN